MRRGACTAVDRIFLADGSALCAVRSVSQAPAVYPPPVPECERVTSYGSPASILVKTQEELDQLHGLGLEMVYMGLEIRIGRGAAPRQ